MNAVLPNRLIEKEELPDITKLSVSTIEGLIRDECFPKPRQLSARRTAWLASDVIEWMENLPVSDLPPPPNTGAKKPRRPTDSAAPAAQAEHLVS